MMESIGTITARFLKHLLVNDAALPSRVRLVHLRQGEWIDGVWLEKKTMRTPPIVNIVSADRETKGALVAVALMLHTGDPGMQAWDWLKKHGYKSNCILNEWVRE